MVSVDAAQSHAGLIPTYRLTPSSNSSALAPVIEFENGIYVGDHPNKVTMAESKNELIMQFSLRTHLSSRRRDGG